MKLTLENAEKNFKEAFHISGEIAEKHCDKIPGGFSRRSFVYGPHPIFVERGDGQYIYTVDGKKLLDFNNNFAVNVVGHNHAEIVEKIVNQIPYGISFGNPTNPEYELAKVLCDRIESIEQVKFSCSASEACLSAVRISRGYTGKTKIAKFEGGYHGFGDELAISGHADPSHFPGPDSRPASLPDSAGIPNSSIENVIVLPQNNLDICETILRENAKDCACVFMELQAAAGGAVVLTKDFVKGIREITKQLGILLIIDETCTLRANYGGMQKTYAVKPDLTVMGKMIGGGIPIGAVGGSMEVMSILEKQVIISGTHHGHVLSCLAGLACLKVMDEKTIEKMNNQAMKIKNEMNRWAEEKGYLFRYLGIHSILGYSFFKSSNKMNIQTYRDYWGAVDNDKMEIYALEMAVRGYYPVARGQISLSSPMTEEDIDGFIKDSKEIIESIYE